jgi:hypothetical protein
MIRWLQNMIVVLHFSYFYKFKTLWKEKQPDQNDLAVLVSIIGCLEFELHNPNIRLPIIARIIIAESI